MYWYVLGLISFVIRYVNNSIWHADNENHIIIYQIKKSVIWSNEIVFKKNLNDKFKNVTIHGA
jgi:hypothetical protein